jgi:dTDP-glucose 4,6-dehydratase
MAYHRQQGVDTAIVDLQHLRPADAPARRPRDPHVPALALQDRPITVFGEGSQTRSFCYVSDLIDASSGSPNRPSRAGEHRQPERVHFARAGEDGGRGHRLAPEIVFEALPTDDPQSASRHLARTRAAGLGADRRAARRLRRTLDAAGVEALIGVSPQSARQSRQPPVEG